MSTTIQTLHGVWYLVEVNGETHYVPPNLVSLDIKPGETVNNPDNDDSLYEKMYGNANPTKDVNHEQVRKDQVENAWFEMVEALRDYVEPPYSGETVESIEARECWGAQYHMPGYMDQTDWVLGDTEEEAVAECKELYGDDDEEDDPVYTPEAGCEYLRTWEEGDFKLIIWDTNRKHHEGAPQWAIAYEFYHKGKLIFQAADFGCSPMHAVDSDKAVGGILYFLSLRPGDVDSDYFASYTPEQMEFAVSRGEELGMYAMELEEGEEE